MGQDSILQSVKKQLGLHEDFDAFDADIIMHINSVLFALTQMGIGKEGGLVIEDDSEVWDDFMDGKTDQMAAVKTLVGLRVRKIFDPPVGSALNALDETISEFEFRLKVASGPY